MKKNILNIFKAIIIALIAGVCFMAANATMNKHGLAWLLLPTFDYEDLSSYKVYFMYTFGVVATVLVVGISLSYIWKAAMLGYTNSSELFKKWFK